MTIRYPFSIGKFCSTATGGISVALFTVIFVLAFWGLSSTSVHAATIAVAGKLESYRLAPHMDMLEDKSASLKLEDVIGASAAMLHPNSGGQEHFGWTKSALWFRVTLVNTSATAQEKVLWVPDSWIDRIECYTRNGSGWRQMVSGDNAPQALRPIKGPVTAFPLALGARETSTIYLRVFSPEDDVQLSFKLSDNGTFEAETDKMHVFTIFWWGFMCAIGVYSLMLSLATKNRSYLYYTLYVFTTMLVVGIIKGYAQWFLWPSAGAWVNRVIPVVLQACYALSSLFAMSFLSTATSAPRLHNLITALAAINIIGIALSIVAPDMAMLSIYVVHFPFLYAAIMIVIGVFCIVKRVPAASLFVVAWVCSLTGISIYVLKILGKVQDGFYTNNAGEIGVAAESFLFLVAIGYQVHKLQVEREAAREAVVAAEILHREELAHFNVELESQVVLKTDEHRKAREDAESATRLKDKFVSLVTHDLRSPLISLTTGLEMLHDDGNLHPENRHFIGMLAKHGRELINMTERLLDLSRLQAGKIILQMRFIKCRGFTASQIGLYQAVAAQKEITIVNDIPDTMKVYADPDLFGECVKNVLSNALKFCNKGDTVTFFNPPDIPSAIAVKDNGPGIAPEKMPLLFKAEMKKRSLGTAGEKGTGIGLVHAKEIMEAHGGTITVESEPGKGCTFFLALPSAFSMTALVVDDQEVVRVAIREHCAGIFPGMLEASNGAEAMEILKNVTPHLIITDINMPVMNGLEFIQQVRNGGVALRVPIIAMTSDESWPTPNGMDIRSYCLHIGADDFVNKPVAASDLVPRISRLLHDAPVRERPV